MRSLYRVALTAIVACCAVNVEASEVFDFAQVVVDAMAQVRILSDPATSQQDPSLNDVMKRAVSQQFAYQRLRGRFEPYTHSKDSLIQQAATAYDGIFWQFQESAKNTADSLESLLNHPEQLVEAPGTQARVRALLNAGNEQAWSMYTKYGMAAVSIALISTEGVAPDQKPERIRLSEAERHQLKISLERQFGPVVTQKATPTSPLNMVPPTMLYEFLCSPRLKSLDTH
jgi:hypothetical protein